jgi:NodT family efflux transporter outer membrane factor (OMF) lipoprotein
MNILIENIGAGRTVDPPALRTVRSLSLREQDRGQVKRLAGGWVLLLLLAGCTVGPDFQPPHAPVHGAYAGAPVSTVSVDVMHGAAQRLVAGADVEMEWWHALGSSKLNGLIDQALRFSPTLAAAEATLRQRQELFGARAGSTAYPKVDASAGVQRQRFNPVTLGQSGDSRLFSLFTAALLVRYDLDLFGGNRRALEALAARTDYQRFQLEAARLDLAAGVALAAISQAELAARLEATEVILRSQEAQVRITNRRVELGQASQDDLLALEAQAGRTRASIPLIRKSLEQSRHVLAALVGAAPGTGGLPSFGLADFALPSELPLVLPSELVRRRPDIQAAEALLHAASADYGVAASKLFPQVSLSATLGSQALTTASLFDSGTQSWGLVGQLLQPLLDRGLPAQERAALAAFDAAAANYQQAVLEALRNVADVLRAIDHDAQSLVAQAAADRSAQALLRSMHRQHALGAASYLQLVGAEQQAQENRIELVAAQARRLADTVALYQAMGGGASHGVAALAAVGTAAPSPSGISQSVVPTRAPDAQ